LLKFKLLGSAAGGGIPQWNCACPLCHLSRTQPQIAPPRLQLQAAFSADDESWTLINASPDLRVQIEANPELQPSPSQGRRNTPIRSIILTSADLDQVLGLLLLREFQPLHIYATPLVRQVLEANSFFRMLERVPDQLTWTAIIPGVPFHPAPGITCTPKSLIASLPFYAKDFDITAPRHISLGLVIESGGRRIAYTPSLPEITDELLEIYNACDVILVDGTFWSDAELSSTHAGTPLAKSIGHIPMSGQDGTIARLAKVAAPKRIFIHINNTNPVLDPRSAEYKQVIDAGWQIGHDGWQLN
jgi:pyrroloquinoline quinone biosynthesis protein B